MKFELEKTLRGRPDEEWFADMRRCAEVNNSETLTRLQYDALGVGSLSAVINRFGSWTKALALAGLKPPKNPKNISDEDLLKNIEILWTHFGRQPRYGELVRPLSKFSASPYETRFGSFSRALQIFVEWIQEEEVIKSQPSSEIAEHKTASSEEIEMKRAPSRAINDRQRFRILVRDGFRCITCGSSPIIKPGVELHIDHIVPWSKGGDTVDENLQTKCKQCNLGKGNAFNV